MKAEIQPNGKIIIEGATIDDIRRQLNAMLDIGGPRGLTAKTDDGKEIHVELFVGGDYVREA